MEYTNIKVQRNTKCPCGSNIKYKKCCSKYSALSPEIKMSEVILEFSREYLDTTETDNENKWIICLACMAWNLSILYKRDPEKQIDKEIDNLVSKLEADIEIQKEIKRILYHLIEKKSREYDSINRFIVNFQINTRGGDLYLSIASSITKEELNMEKNVIPKYD
jgi:hypothetical protein